MSTVEVNYEEFERLHVVRKLRQIVGSWWKVQLNFTDERGFLRGVPQGKFFNPTNSACAFITADANGFKSCLKTARDTTSKNKSATSTSVSLCHAGFSTLTLPLRLDGKFLGCIFADGFVLEHTRDTQLKQISQYFKSNFPNKSESELKSYLESLPTLSQKDVQYLTELIQMIMDEVLLLRKNLFETDSKMEALSTELQTKYNLGNLVGKSHPMLKLFQLIGKVAESDATILVTGENGTGKEGIAKGIHFNSKRKRLPFVIQNCGAINDNLLESELFGHVKGAFTNAVKDKKGLFEVADNGTLFLDEIGDTTPAMQVKLLRVLQEGTFTPVGSTEERKVNVRVVAATNKDLEAMVQEGTFREDLYYRLNVINIKVPPLRDRKDDIPLLTSQFLENYSQATKTPKKKISKECLSALEKHSWPGNVRELQNEIERLCVLAGAEEIIDETFLSDRITTKQKNKLTLKTDATLKEAVEGLEKQVILSALQEARWNKSKVAKKLGISRAGLIIKLKQFGMNQDTTEEEILSNASKYFSQSVSATIRPNSLLSEFTFKAEGLKVEDVVKCTK